MISVIIPTLNRSKLLDKTLRSLTEQLINPNEFEVLVIDNGSTDDTPAVVSGFCQTLNIRHILEPSPGLHEGRHRGLRESRGEILAYADDDIQALPTWLEGIAESFSDPKVGLVGGKNIPDYESPAPPWLDAYWINVPEGKFITYFSLLDFGDEKRIIDPLYVFGCNFSIRKSIVLDAKGFHPDGMPQSLIRFRGDGESFVARHVTEMGYVTMYNPKASIRHWVPASRMNVDYLVKRAFAEGISKSYVDTRDRRLHKKTVRQPTLLSKIKNSIKVRLLNDNQKRIHQSFQEGYRYHQNEMAADKDLLSWVLRDSYM